MTGERKKWIVLGCLVVFWLALIVMQRSQTGSGRPTEVSSAPRRGAAARRPESTTRGHKQGKGPAEIPRLELSQLGRPRPPFEPETRNIFASIEPSPAFPSIPQVAITPSLPPPADPFVEESKKIRFLGFAEADGRTTAFVSYDGEVLVVSQAEVFGGLFRMHGVDEDALILNSTDGTKEVRLEMQSSPDSIPSRRRQRGK